MSEKTEITQLDAPEEVNVSRFVSSDSIFVTWSAVEQATYYRIERAISKTRDSSGNFTEPDDADFEVLSKYVYATSYTDSILKNPTYLNSEYEYGYFYRVSAENPRKKYDASDFKLSEEAGTLFAPVTVISATQGEDSTYIQVTWTKTENASAYKIYRSTYSNGSGATILATVPANQNWYKNGIDSAAQGTEFYYSIYAVNSEGYTTPVSPVALGYSLVEGAPGRVTNVKVTEGRGETIDKITISWDAVSGSDVNYLVYRTSSVDSASTLLTSKDYSATTYTDSKNLVQNVYYYYQVLAYTYDDERNRLKGPISESSASDKNPAEGFLLSPPASLSVVYASDGCTLTFPAAIGSAHCPKDSGLSSSYNSYSYKIYTSDTQAGTFTELATCEDSMLSANEGYYTVSASAAKFYKVSTYRADLNLESALGMVAAPAPYAATGLSATKYAFIENVTAEDIDEEKLPEELKDKLKGKTGPNDQNVYPVKITWEAPNGGADGGYYLYRSTKANSGFRKVQDDPITETEYLDKYDAAKPGTIYYYRVLSLNSLNQGANYSNVDSGYGALTHDQYMREYNKTIKKSHTKFTLMHKSATNALGSESIKGEISGGASYNAKMDGLGARIIMYYDKYVDFYINNDESLGYYFVCTGNTNTSANMSANGSMDGTVSCEGMYPGTVKYDKIEIKGGGAGGGYYVITPEGFEADNVSWTVGEE